MINECTVLSRSELLYPDFSSKRFDTIGEARFYARAVGRDIIPELFGRPTALWGNALFLDRTPLALLRKLPLKNSSGLKPGYMLRMGKHYDFPGDA